MANNDSAKTKRFIGPKTRRGYIINGRLWEKPWTWTQEQIAANCKAEKKLEQYFE